MSRLSADIYTGERCIPLSGRPKRFRFVSFDTEDDTRGSTLLVVFFDGERAKVYRKTQAAIEFLLNLSARKRVILTAHNLEYDLVNLFGGRLRMLEWRFFGSRLISAKLGGTNFTCWDSLNHSYHSPLWKLGETVGYPKLESDYGWTKGRRLTSKDVNYCVRDAEIGWKYMDSQAGLYERIGAQMKSTTPATALDYYRRKFLREPLYELTGTARGFFRKAYYGGRVEIFRLGKLRGRMWYCDVNSLYPAAMRRAYPDVNDLSEGGRFGVTSATVTVPDMPIPPLPVRRDGKLVFPVGRIQGTWCTCELVYAQTLGCRIEELRSTIGSNRKVYPFRSYVNRCYAARLKSQTELERTMWKFILNGLYGKFGTSNLGAQRLVDPKSFPVSKCNGREFYVGDLLCVEEQTDPPSYANVLWAAWTTAVARIILHKALLKAERAGELVYCDTDSVIVRAKRNPFKTGSKLGEWKLEATLSEFEAKAPKLYRYVTKDGETVKAKGVPSDYAEQFFEKMSVTYRKPLRVREAGCRGLVPNVWIDLEKSLHSEYDKRTVHADGTTSPLVATPEPVRV